MFDISNTVPREAECELYRIGAVERALHVVDVLAGSAELSLAQMSERLGIPKATTLRHLRVLQRAGYVSREEGSKLYRLGPALICLGLAARRQLSVREPALPGLLWLRQRYDETTHLGVLHGDAVVHVAAAPSTKPLKMVAPAGERALAHATALGKALLAWPDLEVPAPDFAGLQLNRCTERTIETVDQLERELARVRRLGFAMDNEECADGLRCVAAPITDGGGRVVAALSISGPTSRISRERGESMAPTVKAVAERVSARLGSRAPIEAGAAQLSARRSRPLAAVR